MCRIANIEFQSFRITEITVKCQCQKIRWSSVRKDNKQQSKKIVYESPIVSMLFELQHETFCNSGTQKLKRCNIIEFIRRSPKTSVRISSILFGHMQLHFSNCLHGTGLLSQTTNSKENVVELSLPAIIADVELTGVVN